MNTIKAIVLGAGGRGQFVYGNYSLQYPQDIEFVAVAEPDDGRRNQFAENHNIKSENIYKNWEDVFKRDKFADLVCVCTQDKMHVKPALKAIEMGYDVLLEKPIAPTYEECDLIAKKAKEKGVSVAVAHVLRYTPFFQSLKAIIDKGEIGKIVGIDHSENIGHIHYSHSYVRGEWRNEEQSTPMILAKSCHDMDILLYLTGSNCVELKSYGSRGYFSNKNRPEGAPHRCLENCIHRENCPYFAPKIYLNGNTSWPTNSLTTDLTKSGIIKALNQTSYGVCVFDSDNNMVENQIVAMKFENDINVSFTMSAFTQETTRTIKIMCENGEIIADMLNDSILVYNFSTYEKRTIKHIGAKSEGHGGGDEKFINDFINHLRDKKKFPLKTSIDIALQSHKMAFAAHQSMNSGKSIVINDYKTK